MTLDTSVFSQVSNDSNNNKISGNPIDGFKEGVNNAKEIVKEAGSKAIEKGKNIKEKITKFFSFLGKAGVMLGTALGVVAGLVAAGVIAVTLPVSLPVLGLIAGGLFLGGAIVTLVRNIKDPMIKGAENVIVHTLKDIGSDILMAIPTIIAFINDPKQIAKVINFLKAQVDDVKSDIQGLKDILENPDDKLQEEVKNQLKELKNKLAQYQKKIDKLTKENIEKETEELKSLKTDISSILGNLRNGKESFESFKSIKTDKRKDLGTILSNLNKTFSDEQLDKSFKKLDESFSGNTKDTDETLNVSKINIRDEVEKGNFFEQSNIGTIRTLVDDMNKISISDNSGTKNPVKTQLDNEENNVKNLETESKIKNSKENTGLNDVKDDLKVQLGNIQKAFDKAGLKDLKDNLRSTVSRSGTEEIQERYNNAIANITKLEVFATAIKNSQEEARTPDTLHNIKQDALKAIENLQNSKLVQLQGKELNTLKTSIEALKTDSNKQVSQYKMSVKIGDYKGWKFAWYNYERYIDASLKFNKNTITLALT